MARSINLKTERVHERITDSDGKDLLTYTVDTPSISGADEFNVFYAKVRDNIIAFCREKLILRCVSGGLYSYRHVCKTHIENNVLKVTLKTSFTDKTSRCVLSSHTETHKWDLGDSKLRIIK